MAVFDPHFFLPSVAPGKDVTLLGLLDLSAAFDCVDHDILARRLQLAVVRYPWNCAIVASSQVVPRWSHCLVSATTIDSYRPSSNCYSAYYRALFSAKSCSCFTKPSCSRSSRVPDLSDTRTPTTRRCTSVLCSMPHPRQCQLSASSPALIALMPG